MQAIGPARWRLLTAVEYVGDGSAPAESLLRRQRCAPADLMWLAQQRLIYTQLGSEHVWPGDVPERRLADLDVALTGAGRVLLDSDVWWAVLRAINIAAGGSRSVLRKTLSVADPVLREMAEAGLLEAFTATGLGPVAVWTLHMIPPMLRLRLTGRGRLFLPRF
jgi:hypothetical protein